MAQSPRVHNLWKDENAIHFISTPTFKRSKLFFKGENCQLVWDDCMYFAKKYDVLLLAFVIMPDHLHILFWPQGEKTFSRYMQSVKGHSARQIIQELKAKKDSLLNELTLGAGAEAPAYDGHSEASSHEGNSHIRNLKYRLWQQEFFDYLVTSVEKLEEKLHYIQQNPVEAGLVSAPEEYEWLYVNPKINEIEF